MSVRTLLFQIPADNPSMTKTLQRFLIVVAVALVAALFVRWLLQQVYAIQRDHARQTDAKLKQLREGCIEGLKAVHEENKMVANEMRHALAGPVIEAEILPKGLVGFAQVPPQSVPKAC